MAESFCFGGDSHDYKTINNHKKVKTQNDQDVGQNASTKSFDVGITNCLEC